MDLYILLVFSFLLVYCKCMVTQINIPIDTRCVFEDSCSGLASGVYPSCTNCTKFVTCVNGLYRTFPCPSGTMFDPGAGMCSATAMCNLASLSTANTPNPSPRVTHMDRPTTAPNIPMNTRCVFVDSCSGLASGVYPSCTSCTKFVTCTNGVYGTFPCPPDTMFDPGAGMCSATATCNLASLSTANTPNTSPRVTHMDKPTTTPSTTTTTNGQSRVIVINGRGFSKRITFETGCLRNCYGQRYGYYPSCYGCDRVVICKPYKRRIARCYYRGYKWDDHSKGCRLTSSTCQEKIYYNPWWFWYYIYGRK